MESAILVSIEAEQISVAELRRGELFDLEIEIGDRSMGNVYLGRVERILPGMDAAFVDIGLARNALICAGDVISSTGIGGKNLPLPIEKLLKSNQEIVVQTARAPLENKGARVSEKLSLSGRLVVLESHSQKVGVSRRIEANVERERLRQIAEKLRPHEYGIIVRTEAAGASQEDLAQDIALLMRRTENIVAKARESRAPVLLHREMGLLERLVRDRWSERVETLIVDSEIEYSMLREIVEMTTTHGADRVQFHDSREPIFRFHNVEKAIATASQRVVELPNGGFLVIDEAEALTAIDVNTGKFVGKKRLAETVLQTNLEAARETARQLRLRNIGGVIVIDFIDMDNVRDRVQVMNSLENALKEDRARTRIVQLSPLGLVEMTRQRRGDSLRHSTTQPCPYCSGDGRLQTPANIAINTAREVRFLVATGRKKRADFAVCVTLHPLAALEFVGNDGENHKALEAQLEVEIFLRANAALHHEAQDIKVARAADFAETAKEFNVGTRFEILPQDFVSDTSQFAVAHQTLVRLNEDFARDKTCATPTLWVEVVAFRRCFVEVRVVAQGEPA